jgi:hypothetical protein
MHEPKHAVPAADLEADLAAVEQRLAALGEALRNQDSLAIEQHAHELQRALGAAVHRFTHAARSGGIPPRLRQRLAVAGGQVAAQRESLARATAALDRAIDLLLPATTPATYSASGGAERPATSGLAQA